MKKLLTTNPILWFIAILFFFSCSAIKVSYRMHSTSAHYTDYRFKNKEIRFVGMTHIGRHEFYENVKRLISLSKENGYVLGYEYVDFEGMDLTSKRKLRRLVGFIPTEEQYKSLAETLLGPGFEPQNNQGFMHLVNESDYRLDIDGNELLAAYEKTYGEISLSQEDTLPLNSMLSHGLPKKQAESIILNYRNERLAQKLDSLNANKIILIYGAKHEPGLIKELKKLDAHPKKLSHESTFAREGFLDPLPIDSARKLNNNHIAANGHIDRMNGYANLNLAYKSNLEPYTLEANGQNYFVFPNFNTGIRLSADYGIATVWWTFHPKFIASNNDNEDFGETSGIGFGFSSYRSSWFNSLGFNYQKGFYLDNTNEIYPGYSTQGKKLVNVDLEFASLNISTGYKFNDKFSLRAVKNQTERQLKSAGSFVAEGNFKYVEMDDLQKPRFDSIKSSTAYDFQLSLGYYYTLVPIKYTYICLGVSPGIGLLYGKTEQEEEGKTIKGNHNSGFMSLAGFATLGYNNERIYTGATLTASGSDLFTDVPLYDPNQASMFTVFFGYRFDINRVRRKLVKTTRKL